MHSLDKVDLLVEAFRSLQPMSVERKNVLDKKFRLEFNYNSNHIEGNTLTYGETELLLIFDDTKGNHQFREYEEMKAHDVAYKIIEEWANDKERPLTEQQIKNLNEIILVQPYWKEAITSEGQATRRHIKIGDYKEMPNSVRLQNGEIFEYASPQETPIKMQELIDWYRTEENAVHPVTLAAMLHYNFVRIHPFDDGNGRIARLLLNYILLRNNLPPVIIKSADKANYLRALNRADIGDTEAFIEYVAEQLIWSLEISIKAAKGESIDEPGDLDKKLATFKKKIGQEKNEKLELRYGLKAVIDVVNNLRSLVDEWDITLFKFDTLFYSRENSVQFDQLTKTGVDFYNLYNKVTTMLFGNDVEQKSENLIGTETAELKKIIIRTKFNNLQPIQSKKDYNGGEVVISFHPHLYEIQVSGIKEPILKLYNEHLSSKEISHIVESMGNRLFNIIEKEIEEKGA